MHLLLEGDAVADGPEGVLHHALLKIHKHRGKSFSSGNFNITHKSIFSRKYYRGLKRSNAYTWESHLQEDDGRDQLQRGTAGGGGVVQPLLFSHSQMAVFQCIWEQVKVWMMDP
jgi:hypothetical protein